MLHTPFRREPGQLQNELKTSQKFERNPCSRWTKWRPKVLSRQLNETSTTQISLTMFIPPIPPTRCWTTAGTIKFRLNACINNHQCLKSNGRPPTGRPVFCHIPFPTSENKVNFIIYMWASNEDQVVCCLQSDGILWHTLNVLSYPYISYTSNKNQCRR